VTRIGLRHWLVVLAIALAVHAALLIRFQVQDTLTSTNNGASGVRIALAPNQGNPKPEQVAADAAEENDAPEKQAKPEPQPKSKPEPVPEPEAKPEPSPVPEPEPEPKPQPRPEPKPEPAPKPKPKPEPRPKPQRESSPPASESTSTAARAENARPAGGQDENNTPAQAAQAAENSQEGSTGSVSDTPADYRSELSAALQRHKNYPRRARRLRQEGTVLLYFVMDRSGRVLDWEIRESSGHKLLDEAVRDMIRKANPLPALPDSVSMQRLALTVPIRFQLR
jgi:protein TonB